MGGGGRGEKGEEGGVRVGGIGQREGEGRAVREGLIPRTLLVPRILH